jgi:hypothetical protein
VIERVRHRELQAGSLDPDREDEMALAQLQGNHVEHPQVDLGLGEIDRRDSKLAAQVGDGKLLGQDLLPDQDAGQALTEGALKSEGFR